MPARVHVQEDYETDVEKHWWLAGRLETADVPPGSRRACRSTESKDFDDKMGDPKARYSAVIFNPVPGPPMGPKTRLSFRYKLIGTSSLRVQIYSLTNNYHRRRVLAGLLPGEWREADVDMTELRRPDGSGGPLSEGERIDDIQFYVDRAAQVLIDDILLYEEGDGRDFDGFPKRVVFCGGFDTGAQGKEWPGRFSIVPHEKPRAWKAAQSKGAPLVVDLRGERPVFGPELRLRVLARRRGDGLVTIDAGQVGERPALAGLDPGGDGWKLYVVGFRGLKSVRELRFEVPEGVELTIDDLLLFEPAAE